MSNGSTPILNSCGCCAPGPSLNTLFNRPGLSALAYRIGSYGIFLQRLLDEIHSVTIPDGPNQGAKPLATLTTRALDDPSIALLDAWAVVADVLTFYEERIANEGFLRTATERRSVLELARAIGYELGPGVAASAYLQFTVEEIIGAATPASSLPGLRLPTPPGPGNSAFNAGIVSIPQGTQIQSVPAPGQLPQTFETSTDFEARVEWNNLTPRLVRPADLAISGGNLYLLGTSTSFAPGTFILLSPGQVFLINPLTTLDPTLTQVPAVQIAELYLRGTATNLKAGDKLLLVGTNNGQTATQAFTVREVEVQATLNQTRVAFADNPSLPSFAPLLFPPAALTSQKIPFTQDKVNANIIQKSISESDLEAFLQINGWNARDVATAVNSPPALPNADIGVFVFRDSASFFGNNAPRWKSLPDPTKSQRADPYPNDWDAANNGTGPYIWTDSQGNANTDADIFLERSFPHVLPQSWTLFEAPGATSTAYKITGVVQKALADYSLSGKSTGLKLDSPPNLVPYDDLGGAVLGDPAVVSWAHDRLDIFVVGTDQALYHKARAGSQWFPYTTGYDYLGGVVVGNPTVASWDHDRLDIFVVGTDGGLYHKAMGSRSAGHFRRRQRRWRAVSQSLGWQSVASFGHGLRLSRRRNCWFPCGRLLGSRSPRHPCERHRYRSLPQSVGWHAVASLANELRQLGWVVHRRSQRSLLGTESVGCIRDRDRPCPLPQSMGWHRMAAVSNRLRQSGRVLHFRAGSHFLGP